MNSTKTQLGKYKQRKYGRRRIRRKELFIDPYKLCICRKIYTVSPRKPCSGKRPIMRAEVFSLSKYTVSRFSLVKYVVKTQEKLENPNVKKQIRKKIRNRRIVAVFIHIPGTLNKPKIKLEIPHGLHMYSHVLIKGAHPHDIPGLKYAAARRSIFARASRKGDFLPWPFRRASRSKFCIPSIRKFPYDYRIRKQGGNLLRAVVKYREQDPAVIEKYKKLNSKVSQRVGLLTIPRYLDSIAYQFRYIEYLQWHQLWLIQEEIDKKI
jgi:ribosomal protein S12